MLQRPKTARMFHSKVGCSFLQWQRVKFGWLWVVVFFLPKLISDWLCDERNWFLFWKNHLTPRWKDLLAMADYFPCCFYDFKNWFVWERKRGKTSSFGFPTLNVFLRGCASLNWSEWGPVDSCACAYFDWVHPHILLVFQNITWLNIACLY